MLKDILLNNGIKLLINNDENSNSAVVLFCLNKGSKFEDRDEEGLHHFMEHLLFKGTKKYSTAEITKKLSLMSDNYNAYTTSNSVYLYNQIPFYCVRECVELFSDMYFNSIIPENEMKSEKNVVVTEINMENDDHFRKCWYIFIDKILNNRFFSHKVLGNKKNIINISRKEIYKFYKENYTSDNLTVVINGKITKEDEEYIINLLENFEFTKHKLFDLKKNIVNQIEYGVSFDKVKEIKQIHFIGGILIDALDEIDFIKAVEYNSIFGNNEMDSILFKSIREKEGLCYSINSEFIKYNNKNLFIISSTFDKKNYDSFIKKLSITIKELITNGIEEEVIENLKKRRINTLFIESDIKETYSLALLAYKQHFSKIYSNQEMVDIINSISVNSFNDFFRKIFKNYDNFFVQLVSDKKPKNKELRW